MAVSFDDAFWLVAVFLLFEQHKSLLTAFPHTNLDFLRTNYVSSSIYNEVDRFTNERHSRTNYVSSSIYNEVDRFTNERHSLA